MPISTITPDNLEQLRDPVDTIQQRFGSDIVAIRYGPGINWAGERAIYFRIIVSDAVANDRKRLGEVTGRIMRELSDELGLDELEHMSYFNFRSVSEQAEMQDPAWA